MADLPDTLEAMQRDILHYDLSLNPYLQKSSIPAKDKELKTNAKKVIPAINELLKVINTFSSGIQNFMQDTQNSVNEVLDKIDEMDKKIQALEQSDIKAEAEIEEIETQYEELGRKMSDIQLDISTMMQACKCVNNKDDLEEDKMVFDSKVVIAKNASVVTELKASDISDPEKQFKIYAYDDSSKKYKYIGCTFKQVTSSTSVYNFTVQPLEIVINSETDIITLTNKSSWSLTVYMFKFE